MSIEQKIERFLIEEERLTIGAIPHDEPLANSSLLDSLTFAGLLAFIHREFQVFINLNTTSLDEVDTIRHIAGLVRRLRAERDSGKE